MDELKNFIDNNRDDFENEMLPENHKERFLSKLNKERNFEFRTRRFMRVSFYFTAASVLLFLVLTPILYINKIYKSRDLNVSDYIGILDERKVEITKMADNLNPQEKDMVLNTLDQLTFEAVPFDSQLSDDVKNGERGDLIKQYYSPKIEGINKLEKYVTQLIEQN